MKKEKIIWLVIGSIFILLPFFMGFYHIARMISLVIGIILINISLITKSKYFIIKLIFIPIASILVCYGLDYLSVRLFKTYPIIASKITSSKNMKVYNSIFYRVYDCNNVLTIDAGYKKDFVCNPDILDKISINQFLTDPKTAYKNNKGKFIRLTGKITKIVGTSEIALNTYTSEATLNGYVEFDDNKMVILKELDMDPKDYFIYDNIEVIGKVSSYDQKDDISTIELTNVKIISSGLSKNFELRVNDIKEKGKTKVTEGIYYIGLEGIYYKYDEENIYSIDYLLKDKRVQLEDLIKGIEGIKINDDKDTLYELENYNIIVCKNKDIIFASKKVQDVEKICEMEDK